MSKENKISYWLMTMAAMVLILVACGAEAQCTPTPLNVAIWCVDNGYDLVPYDDRVLAIVWVWEHPASGALADSCDLHVQWWYQASTDTVNVAQRVSWRTSEAIAYREWTEQRLRVRGVAEGLVGKWSEWSEASGNYARLVEVDND
jgi:hypothetical protein